jgi:hypothetical protein
LLDQRGAVDRGFKLHAVYIALQGINMMEKFYAQPLACTIMFGDE